VALSHLPQSTLDIDDFFTITKALQGLGFFVPGDKTVHIGREPLDPISLQFTNDQWRLGGLAAPFILALLEQAEAVGVKNLWVPRRLRQLVRLLSRQHLGSFIVLGNTEKLDALKIKGVHMRPSLSSTFEGQSILQLSDATLLQILGLDGAHFVTLDGKIQAIGMHVLLSDTPAGQSLPGTKRSTALGITQLHEDIVAITVSQDGPTRLWRRGCEISSIG
jgi:DNA integrity scanning protein DisA with diadenylate cyclase activity